MSENGCSGFQSDFREMQLFTFFTIFYQFSFAVGFWRNAVIYPYKENNGCSVFQSDFGEIQLFSISSYFLFSDFLVII